MLQREEAHSRRVCSQNSLDSLVFVEHILSVRSFSGIILSRVLLQPVKNEAAPMASVTSQLNLAFVKLNGVIVV